MFATGGGGTPATTVKPILNNMVWALVGGLILLVLSLLGTFLFEMFIYAPSDVMEQAGNNPPWDVREQYLTAGMKLGRVFQSICGDDSIRIMSAPDRVPESAYLYGFLRNVALTEGCKIANDAQDLNRQPDADKLAYFRPDITIHALLSHRAEADSLMMLLSSMSPPTGWHFERGSEMPKGTDPTAVIAIELGRTLHVP